MRIHLRPTLSNARFPTKHLPTNGCYYQVVLEDDLVDVEVPSIRLVTGCYESIGGREPGGVEVAQ